MLKLPKPMPENYRTGHEKPTSYKGVPYETDRSEEGWRYRVKINGQMIQSNYFKSITECLVDLKKQVNAGENLLSAVIVEPIVDPAPKARKSRKKADQ